MEESRRLNGGVITGPPNRPAILGRACMRLPLLMSPEAMRDVKVKLYIK